MSFTYFYIHYSASANLSFFLFPFPLLRSCSCLLLGSRSPSLILIRAVASALDIGSTDSASLFSGFGGFLDYVCPEILRLP